MMDERALSDVDGTSDSVSQDTNPGMKTSRKTKNMVSPSHGSVLDTAPDVKPAWGERKLSPDKDGRKPSLDRDRKTQSPDKDRMKSSPDRFRKKLSPDKYRKNRKTLSPNDAAQTLGELHTDQDDMTKCDCDTSMVRFYDTCLLVAPAGLHGNDIILRFIEKYKKKNGKSHPDINMDLTEIQKFLDGGTDIDQRDLLGQTVLMEAARSWHADVVCFLLGQGADPRLKDERGRAVIHTATASNRDDVIRLLVDRLQTQADRMTLVNTQIDTTQETCLHLAARRGNIKALEAILDVQGCDLAMRDYLGRTALFVAAEHKNQDAVKILLKAGSEVVVTDTEGRSLFVQMAMSAPLHMDRALSKLMTMDRQTNNIVVDPEILNTSPQGWYEKVHTNCLLDQIESEERGKAVKHPVIRTILQMKWDTFGKKWSMLQFLCSFVFFLVWCVWLVAVDQDHRMVYEWPQDFWKVLLPILGFLLLLIKLRIEFSEFTYSIRRGVTMARLELRRKKTDREWLTHLGWPDELDKLDRDIRETKRRSHWWHQMYNYYKDPWNFYDLLVYLLVIVCVLTHIRDILQGSRQNTQVYIRVFTLLLLGNHLIGETRKFPFLAKLVITLGLMLGEFIRFVLLYIQIYFPFTMAFWVVFGGSKYPTTQRWCTFNCSSPHNSTSWSHTKELKGWVPEFDHCESNCSALTVDGMTTYSKLCFALFRITLVDDYDFDTMVEIDPYLSYLLITMFFIASAIVAVNFLIGLISGILNEENQLFVEIHTILLKIRTVNILEQSIMRGCKSGVVKYDKDIWVDPHKVVIQGTAEIEDSLPIKEAAKEIKKLILSLREEVDDLKDEVDDIKHEVGDIKHRVGDIGEVAGDTKKRVNSMAKKVDKFEREGCYVEKLDTRGKVVLERVRKDKQKHEKTGNKSDAEDKDKGER